MLQNHISSQFVNFEPTSTPELPQLPPRGGHHEHEIIWYDIAYIQNLKPISVLLYCTLWLLNTAATFHPNINSHFEFVKTECVVPYIILDSTGSL